MGVARHRSRHLASAAAHCAEPTPRTTPRPMPRPRTRSDPAPSVCAPAPRSGTATPVVGCDADPLARSTCASTVAKARINPTASKTMATSSAQARGTPSASGVFAANTATIEPAAIKKIAPPKGLAGQPRLSPARSTPPGRCRGHATATQRMAPTFSFPIAPRGVRSCATTPCSDAQEIRRLYPSVSRLTRANVAAGEKSAKIELQTRRPRSRTKKDSEALEDAATNSKQTSAGRRCSSPRSTCTWDCV